MMKFGVIFLFVLAFSGTVQAEVEQPRCDNSVDGVCEVEEDENLSLAQRVLKTFRGAFTQDPEPEDLEEDISSLLPSDVGQYTLHDMSAMELKKTLEHVLLKMGDRVTPGLKKLVSQMKGYVAKDMKPSITEAHKTDQSGLHKMGGSVTFCDTTRKHTEGKLDVKLKGAQAASASHGLCRTKLEKPKADAAIACPKHLPGLKKAMEDWCKKKDDNQKDTKKFNACSASCDYKTQGAETCWDAAHANVKDLEDFFKERSNNYRQLVQKCVDATKAYDDKVIECDKKEEDRIKQKSECDKDQVEAELAHCSHRADYGDMCEAYGGCRDKGDKAFADATKGAKQREVDRKKEWTATLKIDCLLHTWGDTGKVDAAAIDKCDKTTVNTDHFTLDVPKVAAKAACDVPALPDYDKIYATLPTVAPAEEVIACEGPGEEPAPVLAPAPACKGKECKEFSFCLKSWHVGEEVKGKADSSYLRHRKGAKGHVVCGYKGDTVDTAKGHLGICWKEVAKKGHNGWSSCGFGLKGSKTPSFCDAGTLWFVSCTHVERSSEGEVLAPMLLETNGHLIHNSQSLKEMQEREEHINEREQI